jgi:hypothetical protein
MTIATGISGLITARVEMIFMMGDVFK